MIYSQADIFQILDLLDEQNADSLESETLDFKECDTEEKLKAFAQEYAVCFGNASGGTVVFGVRDKPIGRSAAIVGIDFAPDLGDIQAFLYDTIDPKLPVKFDWMDVENRRLLLMHVISTTPPYTTTGGRGWIRVGKHCKPLVGSLLRQLQAGAGLSDLTREMFPLHEPMAAVSEAALDVLRREMRRFQAPEELLKLPAADLCTKLGILREGRLTLGGLLVVGREEALTEYVPSHEWRYSRMRSDTDYETQPASGRECILLALEKITGLLQQQNPITTVPSGLFHAEFPQYPTIALREVLLNAFAHRDYSIPGMVFIRHWKDGIEVNSPGSFVGGVSPNNILHHAPVTRNRYLVETILQATRLVNRNNLGVPRMFRALLQEGKEPPEFSDAGETVRVTFPGQAADFGFKALVTFLVEQQHAELDVDTLLLLHFFHRRHEAQWEEVRQSYPYDDRGLRERLAWMETRLFLLEHTGGGRGPNTVYRLTRQAEAILNSGAAIEQQGHAGKEAMKLRILSLLAERPLHNQELRTLTGLSRARVTILLQELAQQEQVRLDGRGSGALWRKT